MLQSEDVKGELVRTKAGTVPVLFSLALWCGGYFGSTKDQTCLASGLGKGDDGSATHPPSLGSLGGHGSHV